MKRWIALAVGALALFGAAHPVAAVSRAPANGSQPPSTTQPAPPNDPLGLAFSQQQAGQGLAVNLDAGANGQHDLVIANRTNDLRLSVRLTASDATGALDVGTASWIAFGADVVQIDPNGSKTVPVTIAVPHDTQPGQELAHVVATIDSAVLASDSTPRTLSLHKVLPVSITVNGAPTAQIAITDVKRVDKGSTHQLGVVMRNFGDQGATVSGTVRVAGAKPQSHTFNAQLAPRRDTTLLIPWDAPSKDVASDVQVEASYGGGDSVSWAAQVGGPPPVAVALPTDSSETPTSADTTNTVATQAGDGSSDSSTTAAASGPWWKKDAVPGVIVLAIVLAAVWFFFEMRSSKKRRDEMPAQMPFFVMPGMIPPMYGPPAPMSNDATVELAKQLVALSEVIVRMATGEQTTSPAPSSVPQDRARARSPEADPPPASVAPSAHVTAQSASFAPTWNAWTETEPQARVFDPPPPEPAPDLEPEPVAVPDPRETAMQRLVALDRERRRLHQWMDASEESEA
jgi:hypothetical protein